MRIEEKQKMATDGKKQLTLDRFFQKGEASTSAKVHVYDDGDDDGDKEVDAEAAALTRRQLRSRPKASEASGARAGKRRARPSTSAREDVKSDDGDNEVDAEVAAYTRRQLRPRFKASEASGASAGKRGARLSTSPHEDVDSDDDEEYPESDGYSSEEWVQSDHGESDSDSLICRRLRRSRIVLTATSHCKDDKESCSSVTLLRVSKIKVHRPVDPRKKIPKILAGMKQAGPFTAEPGPRGAAAELNSTRPVDFLQLFMTDELLQHIADQTNLYACQSMQKRAESLPHCRSHAWKPVSVSELKTFFALQFLTGYINKPSIEMYWTQEEIETTPFFSRAMPRNRFQLIWSFLHFNDNETHSSDDKLFKIRPVFNHVVSKFKELFQPGRNICIDEGMMSFQGRLSFKVYNPQKLIKYGIKSYILCDSQTGYCFNMQPYVGISCFLPDTVFNLLDRLPGNGYTLFMDNFYNSIALCERLLAARTNVCGTLRKNRG
ncbi:N-acetyllactosaminide beta-1,3-N-acetylglucosaminyltransferase 2 isoform X1 [Vanacampus margaritifer]